MSGLIHNRILLIGFAANVSLSPYFRDMFGTAEEIRTKLDNEHDRIHRAGITPVSFGFNPEEKEKSLVEMESLLREGKYDAIGIGAGVRLDTNHTALFEAIVNLCRTIAPTVPLMFTNGPGGSVEALARVIGVQIP